jgi:hypothetical protein
MRARLARRIEEEADNVEIVDAIWPEASGLEGDASSRRTCSTEPTAQRPS